jgi:arylsulfatase A-like enzyme
MNVIVVVADSLRYDHLGCNGNPWIRTPHLDAFATEATRFTRTYSEGLPTLPTRTAYWTGRYTLPFRGWQSVVPGDPLLAEHLLDKGYTSALVTDVYHMHGPRMSFGRGFDTVRFIRGQEYDAWQVLPDEAVDVERHHRMNGVPEDEALWRPRFIQYLKNVSVRRREADYFAPQVVNAGLEWLDAQPRKDDLFLWMDLFDPHEPWDPPAPYGTMYDPDYRGQVLIDPIPGFTEGYLTPEEVRHVAALYAGEVSFVDHWLGRFFRGLKDLGLWDNSLIVFTSDHGELLGERGCIRKARPWPYDELSRIPMLMRLPGGEGAGSVVDAFAQTPDLLPTVCHALGIDPPAGTHGRSLLPLVRGTGTDNGRDFAISGFHGQSWSIRNDEWSLYLWLPGYVTVPWDDKQPNTRELYRLADDPGETLNLADTHADVADALELALRRHIAGLRWE